MRSGFERRRSLITIAAIAIAAVYALRRGGGFTGAAGRDAFGEFWIAALSPELDPEFLRRVLSASASTASFALLGTLLALCIGVLFAPLLAESTWDLDRMVAGRRRHLARATQRVVRTAAVVPRSIHEFVFALALIQIFGLDPIVAIVSIGIPFGAVTARVFAEMLDGADRRAVDSLRAAGAPRAIALIAGSVATARKDLLSYGFYRFECAMRSAAVLGIIGAGGLGYELALSFESLKYGEVWTAIWALVILSGLADRWSSHVRRDASGDAGLRSSVLLLIVTPLAWWWAKPEVGRLWSKQSRELGADLAGRAWPPALGTNGFAGLVLDSLDTIAISVLAIALAASAAVGMAFVAGGGLRPSRSHPTFGVRVSEFVTRSLLLIMRAVPPPVWAFVVVLLLLPGIIPGAVALGLYNLGVLGRLMSEVLENDDDGAAPALRLAGSPSIVAFVVAGLPSVRRRWQGLAFYRWEVAVRDTVMVGAAGATGLGRTLTLDLAGRAFDRALAVVIALLVVNLIVDEIARRAISPNSSDLRSRDESRLAAT